jgi:hypothetical protein
MDASICIPNIGPRQRRRRLIVGTSMIAIAAVTAVSMVGLGAGRALRMAVFLPLVVGLIGLLQVRAKTCVALAARGLRNMDGGDEAIADPGELRAVKAQARRVNIQAVLIASAITALLLALPAAKGQ